MVLYGLAISFFAFALIDIIGHIAFKIKRNAREWFAFSAVVACAVFFMVNTFNESKNIRDDKAELYIGYKYLQDDNPEQAKKNLDMVVGEYDINGDILQVVADIENKDYEYAYFEAEQIREENGDQLDDGDMECLEKLMNICESKMKADKLSDSMVSESAKNVAKDYMDDIKLGAAVTKKLEKEYQIDRRINVEYKDVNDLFLSNADLNNYEESERGLRYICKYYVISKDYKKAKKYASKLVNLYPRDESYVIYTDIIVQEAYENKDTETIKRALNYLIAKKTENNSRSGMYNLQIAKLYWAMGERDNAKTYLDDIFLKSIDIDSESVIKRSVDNVVNEINKLTADSDKTELKTKIQWLVGVQSSNIVVSSEGQMSINEKFSNYVMGELCKELKGDSENSIYTNNSSENNEEAQIEKLDTEVKQSEVDYAENDKDTVYFSGEEDLTNQAYETACIFLNKGSSVKAYINNKLQIEDDTKSGEFGINLVEGENKIKFVVTDKKDNKTVYEQVITLDTVAPELEILENGNDILTTDNYIYMCGKTDTDANINIDGENIENSNGYFNSRRTLDPGKNTITITVSDEAGNKAMYVTKVDFELNRERRLFVYGLTISFVALGGIYLIIFLAGAKRKKHAKMPVNASSEKINISEKKEKKRKINLRRNLSIVKQALRETNEKLQYDNYIDSKGDYGRQLINQRLNEKTDKSDKKINKTDKSVKNDKIGKNDKKVKTGKNDKSDNSVQKKGENLSR